MAVVDGGVGSACALYVDTDRDGKLDPATERVQAARQPAGDGGLSARFEDVPFGATNLVVALQRRTASFGGMLGRPAPRGQRPEPAKPLAFSPTPPEGVKVPALTGTVAYATVKDGDATIHVAAARDGAGGLTLVLADDPEFKTAVTSVVSGSPLRRGARVVGTRWTASGLAVGGKDRVVNLSETVDNAFAQVTPAATRKGTVEVEGKPHVLYLLDGDFDGAYGGAEDAWWFGPPSALPNPNVNNMTEGDAPGLLEGGLVWTLAGVGVDGVAKVVWSRRPEAADEVLHRRAERVNAKRWFPLFAADKEFDKARPPDPTRPRAERPFRFRFALTLDDARALAVKEGKPLLVDFEADWCVWCKRLDYHTYPDAGVVEALGRFTCVKVNNELDPKKSCAGLGWRGIPAVGIFGLDGAPVVFQMPPREGRDGPVVDHIPGFLMPKDFVAALDAALAALDDVKGGKAPLVLPAPKAPEAPRPPAAPTTPPAPEKAGDSPPEKAPKKPVEAPPAGTPPPQAPTQPEPAPMK